MECGLEVPVELERVGGGWKRARSSVSAAVEMAQAIARSRLQDYTATPLMRLQPISTTTTTTTGWTEDSSHDDISLATRDDVRPRTAAVAKRCYEKTLLIQSPECAKRKPLAPFGTGEYVSYTSDVVVYCYESLSSSSVFQVARPTSQYIHEITEHRQTL